MDSFSISQLARFSGIKPHTIRIWEQRYNALKPMRSEGNTRYYNGNQLRRLLNIVSLSNLGYKVSELCSSSDDKLARLITVTHDHSANTPEEYYISQLIGAGMSYDEIYFEKIFSHFLLQHGMKDTYLKLLYPMMARVGMLWACDDMPPAHEHFITNLVHQKIRSAINLLPPAKTGASWLLFLPEDEYHETGLLFASYLIRLRGSQTIYLGGNLPYSSLMDAVKYTGAQNFLIFFVRNDFTENYQEYTDRLSRDFKRKKIFIAGNDIILNPLKKRTNIYRLKSVDDLEQQLHISSV